YTPEQVFDVVAGVERYADFLPWCVGSHVLWRAPDGMEAELEIGFHMLREKYLSLVTYKRPVFVTARSTDTGLFHHLDNHWEFSPGRFPGSCLLSFSVDFQFRSLLYTQFLDLFFDEVVQAFWNWKASLGHAVRTRTTIAHALPRVEAVARLTRTRLRGNEGKGEAGKGGFAQWSVWKRTQLGRDGAEAEQRASLRGGACSGGGLSRVLARLQ
ncbi:unnamed protein product, partial [Closterium sp. NIES-65]